MPRHGESLTNAFYSQDFERLISTVGVVTSETERRARTWAHLGI